MARLLQRPGVEVVPLGKGRIGPLCPPALKRQRRAWKEILLEAPLIDSQLSRVTWSDWFAVNGLQVPDRPRASFDRGALSISAAVDGMGIALGTTRFAERELSRGDLIEISGPQLKPIFRETHLFSQRTSEIQVERIAKSRTWLLEKIQ